VFLLSKTLIYTIENMMNGFWKSYPSTRIMEAWILRTSHLSMPRC
jgi:hypothetical protein